MAKHLRLTKEIKSKYATITIKKSKLFVREIIKEEIVYRREGGNLSINIFLKSVYYTLSLLLSFLRSSSISARISPFLSLYLSFSLSQPLSLSILLSLSVSLSLNLSPILSLVPHFTFSILPLSLILSLYLRQFSSLSVFNYLFLLFSVPQP